MSIKYKTYEVYHGTSSTNVESILEHGFYQNPKEEDWLGHGIYFFTQGISCPINNALCWAINNSYDNKKKAILYTSASVLKTTIKVLENKILDLTNINDLKKYNKARLQIISDNMHDLKTRRDLTIKKRKDFRVDDQIIMNKIITLLNVDIVISHLYIKNKSQRQLELESTLPNCTVISVINRTLIEHNKTHEVITTPITI